MLPKICHLLRFLASPTLYFQGLILLCTPLPPISNFASPPVHRPTPFPQPTSYTRAKRASYWDPITNDVMSEPETVDLIAGDILVFMSDQGPVNLKFDPPENFGVDQVVNGALHVQIGRAHV